MCSRICTSSSQNELSRGEKPNLKMKMNELRWGGILVIDVTLQLLSITLLARFDCGEIPRIVWCCLWLLMNGMSFKDEHN